MNFDDKVIMLGKEIYKKVYDFVQANKGEDNKLYRKAILKLNDGRKMEFLLELSLGEADVKIWNYNWNDELQSGEGDAFRIMPRTQYGFLISVNFYYLNNVNFYFTTSEKNYPYKKELTDEDMKKIVLYMNKLYELVDTLEYDKEATHSVNNLTYDAKKQYNIQQFNEAMQNVSESSLLPSVETAVNWWIDKFTESINGGSIGDNLHSFLAMAMVDKIFNKTPVYEKQSTIFRNFLSKRLMDELSKGREVHLDVDYGPSDILADAMEVAGIDSIKAPFKTHMIVGVNSVRVSVGYGAKYEEIYNNEKQKKMYLKNN